MARSLSSRALAVAALATLTLCATRGAHAQSKCSESPAQPGSVDPAYGADADNDGVPDEVAKHCMAGDGQGLTRDPWCYLALGFMPASLAGTKSNPGAFWKDAACTPALAFPVDDRALGLGHGVVIVGASASTAEFIGDAIEKNANSWTAAFAPGLRPVDDAPPSSQALCLVSVDYASTPKCAVTTSSPQIATFYAHFCPSGSCDSQPSTGELWPTDGLGLARSQTIEPWHVRRPILATDVSDVDRFAFARGVMYLAAPKTAGCSSADAMAIDLSAMTAFDPTGGPPRFGQALRCPDAKHSTEAPVLPVGVTLVPPDLDSALLQDASARESAVAGTPPRLLEGVPYGLVADIRTDSSSVGSTQSSSLDETYLLGTRALLAPIAGMQARPGAQGSFVVVPESIAALDQHLVFDARSLAFVVRALRPLAAAERAAEQPGRGVRRTSQEFEIESGAARTIEALESTSFAHAVWPPHAATFDVSERYGTRWTSNDGALDCFATTALAAPADPWLRFAYPVASGASGEVTPEYCPNELDAWLERTRPVREGSQPICATADHAMEGDAEQRVVFDAVAKCVARAPSTDAGVTADAGTDEADVEACLRSGCDPLQPGTCPGNPRCYEVFKRLAVPSPVIEQCIVDGALAGTEALLPASAHWPNVLDGQRMQLVSMVEMIRTTDAASEEPVPVHQGDAGIALQSIEMDLTATLTSHMTQGDAFFGGAHQTPDWNWIVKPEQREAIDPAYRGIAVINGRFVKMENELEFGVPSGLWDTHVRTAPDHAFNTHGVADFGSFLQSQKTAEKLAEIWPTDFCSLFGIARGGGSEDEEDEGGASIPTAECAPCISCDPGAAEAGCRVGRTFFRTHLGRGIFSPISAETISGDEAPDTAFMATSQKWPGCPSGQADKPDDVASLGLEDWDACPHRMTFLGRPILDCGHGDDGCDTTHRMEIHPPHVITLEVRHETMHDANATCPQTAPCMKAAAAPGCTPGVVSAVFGWANVNIGRHLEFDLWPPPRPAGDSALCTLGDDHEESTKTFDMGVVKGLGFRIVKPPAQPPCGKEAGASTAAPTLHCSKVPTKDPNHLHCVYTDPLAEGCTDVDARDVAPEFTYGNPRMTPHFATSLFEARIFMGWATDAKSCPASCGKDAPCDD